MKQEIKLIERNQEYGHVEEARNIHTDISDENLRRKKELAIRIQRYSIFKNASTLRPAI